MFEGLVKAILNSDMSQNQKKKLQIEISKEWEPILNRKCGQKIDFKTFMLANFCTKKAKLEKYEQNESKRWEE